MKASWRSARFGVSVIIFNERQLRRILESYHKIRPHRSLTHDSPIPRPVEASEIGKVIELPAGSCKQNEDGLAFRSILRVEDMTFALRY